MGQGDIFLEREDVQRGNTSTVNEKFTFWVKWGGFTVDPKALEFTEALMAWWGERGVSPERITQ